MEDVDVLVIGAGPAGAAAAWSAARLGVERVLLVERCGWPRAKVCGGCLNPAGWSIVGRMDAASMAGFECGRYERVRIRDRGRVEVVMHHVDGRVVERSAFDDRLVRAARAAGARFESGVSARVIARGERLWRVDLAGREVGARVVIACDGLSGRSLDAVAKAESIDVEIAPDAWMGAGAIVSTADSTSVGHDLPANEVHMHLHDEGYVGVVRLPGARIDIAGALRPAFVQRRGGPGPAMVEVLNRCGFPNADELLHDVPVRGVPLLTRRRPRLGTAGLIIAGDAAGYVEPFTGEGMTWAMAQGEHAGAFAVRALRDVDLWEELGSVWQSWRRRALEPRSRGCRIVRSVLHRPALRRAAMRFLSSSQAARGMTATAIRHGSRTYPIPSAGGVMWA